MGYWVKTIDGKTYYAKSGVSWDSKTKAKKYAEKKRKEGYSSRVIFHRVKGLKGKYRVFMNRRRKK